MSARIVSVAKRKRHGVGKDAVDAIELIAGQGVSGDAHCGAQVKHRSRARFNPSLPNLRQVHLLHAELLDELVAGGFAIVPAQMGENITTRGIDLLSLPAGTRLALGKSAIIELTGLRNPCIQLERMMPGLMQACLDQGTDGALLRKAGVMAVVVADGLVQSGDVVIVTLPAGAHQVLKPV